MNDQFSGATQDAPIAVLVAAERHYQRTITALDEMIREAEAGHTPRAKELRQVLTDLAKATQTAFDERSRIEKRLQSERGAADGYAIDLAGARLEIGRRLACLRDAAGAGGVPGGSE